MPATVGLRLQQQAKRLVPKSLHSSTISAKGCHRHSQCRGVLVARSRYPRDRRTRGTREDDHCSEAGDFAALGGMADVQPADPDGECGIASALVRLGRGSIHDHPRRHPRAGRLHLSPGRSAVHDAAGVTPAYRRPIPPHAVRCGRPARNWRTGWESVGSSLPKPGGCPSPDRRSQ